MSALTSMTIHDLREVGVADEVALTLQRSHVQCCPPIVRFEAHYRKRGAALGLSVRAAGQ